MKKCYRKECCCRCKFLVKIYKHPSNNLKCARGAISEFFGYGCKCFSYFDSFNQNKIVFMNSKHGACEMFTNNLRKKDII